MLTRVPYVIAITALAVAGTTTACRSHPAKKTQAHQADVTSPDAGSGSDAGSASDGGASPGPTSASAAVPTATIPDARTQLVGTDADGNGVRDDVDAALKKTYGADDKALSAAIQTGRAVQSLVATGGDDKKARAASHVYMDALDCLEARLGDQWRDASNFILTTTLDDDARVRAYWQAQQSASGESLPLTDDADLAKKCT